MTADDIFQSLERTLRARRNELFERATANETASAEIRRVDAAIARFDSGDYGVCVRCSEILELDALQREPTAELCASCSSKSG